MRSGLMPSQVGNRGCHKRAGLAGINEGQWHLQGAVCIWIQGCLHLKGHSHELQVLLWVTPINCEHNVIRSQELSSLACETLELLGMAHQHMERVFQVVSVHDGSMLFTSAKTVVACQLPVHSQYYLLIVFKDGQGDVNCPHAICERGINTGPPKLQSMVQCNVW